MYYSVKRSVLRVSAINAFNLTFYLLLVYASVFVIYVMLRPVDQSTIYFSIIYLSIQASAYEACDRTRTPPRTPETSWICYKTRFT